MFIEFLLTHKSLALTGVLFAMLASAGVYIKILDSEVVSAKADVKVLTSNLAVSQASVKTLQKAVTDQNTAITKLGTDATARVASHQGELAKATTTADIYRKQATDLMHRQAPQNAPKCDAANALINSEIKNAK